MHCFLSFSGSARQEIFRATISCVDFDSLDDDRLEARLAPKYDHSGTSVKRADVSRSPEMGAQEENFSWLRIKLPTFPGLAQAAVLFQGLRIGSAMPQPYFLRPRLDDVLLVQSSKPSAFGLGRRSQNALRLRSARFSMRTAGCLS
jgi:hypothetical protein